MLSRCGIVPEKAALVIRGELVKLWDLDPLQLPAEEDVHMAVEAHLTAALGETAGMLHTARSRNDQVALDLRLHVREQAAQALEKWRGSWARWWRGRARRRTPSSRRTRTGSERSR